MVNINLKLVLDSRRKTSFPVQLKRSSNGGNGSLALQLICDWRPMARCFCKLVIVEYNIVTLVLFIIYLTIVFTLRTRICYCHMLYCIQFNGINKITLLFRRDQHWLHKWYSPNHRVSTFPNVQRAVAVCLGSLCLECLSFN